MESETEEQYAQDALLGIAFLIVGFFSCWRLILYFSPSGGGKVITLFFSLITATALVRALWFLIPSTTLEGTYSPLPVKAFETIGWKGVLISEILLAIGSLSLYAVFLLVICYWAHMLQKVENPDVPETNYLLPRRDSQYQLTRTKRGPMETFGFMMLFLVGVESLNILLFIFRFYNSEAMILFDSLLFSITSLATLLAISLFSNRIRIVLTMMGVINGNSTKPQVRRILAITVAANIFFGLRLLIEVSISLYLISLWTANKSFYVLVSDNYWNNYIFFKHWSEVCVLALELLISTSTKSLSQSKPTNQSERNNPRRTKRKKNPARLSHESELLPLRGSENEENYRGVAV